MTSVLKRSGSLTLALLVTLAVVPLATSAAFASDREVVARVSHGPASIDWLPMVEYERLVLTISAPGGEVTRHGFQSGQAASISLFDRAGQTRPDGSYTYELVAAPRLSAAAKAALDRARQTGEESEIASLRASGQLPAPMIQSGSFAIRGGTFASPNDEEPGSAPAPRQPGLALRDQVIPDDLIVQSSICVGFDCVNGESFGFDTIRLKENNLRIAFMDTSVGTFPSNDWQLVANDSASGGQNQFSILDVDSARVPFLVEAGATTNSVRIDSTGRIGLRTATPVLDLHISTSNTPGIRLEQNSSGGFTAQTWDIAGNEANFFVRDVTGGSRLSFRIRPGAPTSSVDINADGNVGVGTGAPAASMDIVRSGSAATHQVTSFSDGAADAPQFIARRADGTSSVPGAVDSGDNLGLFSFRGHTGTSFSGSRALVTALATENWSTSANGAKLTFSTTANGTTSPTIRFEIQEDGDIAITGGVVVHASSRELKQNFAAADPQAILERVANLPVTYWNYTKDDPSERHLGPVAEDFYASFGLGDNDKYIALNDSVGVALAAVQGLHQQLQARDQEITDLKARLAALEAAIGGE